MVALVVSAVLVVVAIASPASASVRYVTQWGGSGTGEGEFGGPVDLAATSSGAVYVSDTFNLLVSQIPRVQRFTTNGLFVLEWGSSGAGNGQFQSPGGIATGPSGDVYVGDFALNRIQRFDADGNYLGQWGTPGSGKGEFTAPWGVATDPQGRVYVVDYGNNRIQKFSADGAFLGQWGSFGSGNGRFLAPTFVATDSGGHVYVADSGNSRIQKFTSGGKYLGQWASPGPGAGVPDFPLGVATDPKGNVYVVGTNSVQKYSPKGSLLTRWGEFGRGDGQFRNPQGIATDSSGNVYVGDSGNDRVQKFHDSGPPYPDPGTARLKVIRPSPIHIRGGRSGSLLVSVRNTGSNAARKVSVCARRSAGDNKSIRRIACVRLGSIAAGRVKSARLRVRARCRSAATARLRLRATASNAGPATANAVIRIADCRPTPPLPGEGLG